jgi:hypothetical protein
MNTLDYQIVSTQPIVMTILCTRVQSAPCWPIVYWPWPLQPKAGPNRRLEKLALSMCTLEKCCFERSVGGGGISCPALRRSSALRKIESGWSPKTVCHATDVIANRIWVTLVRG